MSSKRAEKVVLSATTGTPGAATPTPEAARTPSAVRSARTRTASDRAARWSAKCDVVEVLASSGHFEMLGRALRGAGLAETLAGVGPYTVFAPTDSAFAAVPGAELHALLEDTAALKRMLALHIVPDRVRAPQVGRPTSAVTIDGRTLALTNENGEYRVEDVRIVKTNIRASNGVIHAVNGVLLRR